MEKDRINTDIKSYYFKGIKINIVLQKDVFKYIQNAIKKKIPCYICVNDVGNIVNAYKKFPDLMNAINNSYISLPDGQPLAILGRKLGNPMIERIAGPDLANLIFSKTDNDVKHFILGDTEEYHQKLLDFVKKNYKDVNICGTFSPPFGEWDNKINNEIKEKITDSEADIIWVCLGGGKQEIWMYENYKKYKKGVFIGIGAGFKWLTGDIKRAPIIFRKIGMEWIFRLIQQPNRMFKRYMSTLPFFMIDSFKEILKNKNKIIKYK